VGAGQAKNKSTIMIALAAGAFAIVVAVGGAFLFSQKSGDEVADTKAKAGASATGEVEPAAAAAAAPADSAATAKNEPAASASAPAGSDTQAQTPPASSAAAPKETAAQTAAATPTPPSTPQPAAPSRPAAPTPAPAKDTGGVPAAVAAAGGGSTEPFNMGEAKARLAATAAAAQSCKKGDASGTGRVVVVFAPNGSAQSATISGPPFEGTPTGACVAARFRGVHVPAFSGSPFSVAKSFTIN
jgi:hypothetical protein